jgi:hypothetical protein
MSLTDYLYRLSRLSAAGRAARKGPTALAKRQVRRAVYRNTNKTTRKVLKGFGL